jgi:aminopeptidase N
VRPEEYVEINNFYTATVYEKGAEVIRMLRTLVGPRGYRDALDLYFRRHDGQACTIEDFRRCFEDATGRDLGQFARWWSQSGTPVLTVSEAWDARAGRYALTFRQATPPTPGQPAKKPFVIPVALGLLGPDGADLLPETTRVVELDTEGATVTFDGLAARPVPSLLRGFSAPVRLERPATDAERAFLLAHDSDPFAKWEAGRAYAMDVVLRMLDGAAPDPDFALALDAMMQDGRLDPAFRALALELPGEDEVAQEVHARGRPADPEAIHAALRALRRAIAARLEAEFVRLHERMAVPGPYAPDAPAAAKRALRNRALGYLAALGTPAAFARVAAQYETADNMSERLPALALLVHHGAPQVEAALAAFHDRWKGDGLVIDKWLAVQATAPVPDALARIEALTRHPSFDWLNPNRFRSLIGAFAQGNPSRFHAADGAGYAFFADWLIRLDARNPQTAARLAGAFETWRRYDAPRQALIRAQLERIAGTEGLSKDVADIVGRILAA